MAASSSGPAIKSDLAVAIPGVGKTTLGGSAGPWSWRARVAQWLRDRNGFAAAALPKSVKAKTNLERGLSMRRYEEATSCYASTKLLSRRSPWA